jgi:hypothetical protein
MREPLLLSHTISALVVSMAYLYPPRLHTAGQALSGRDKNEESLQSTRHGITTAQTDQNGVHRWVIISKLVGVAICKFVIMYGDRRPPNWFDAQLIPAGERIGDQFDEGIDKARPDEARYGRPEAVFLARIGSLGETLQSMGRSAPQDLIVTVHR